MENPLNRENVGSPFVPASGASGEETQITPPAAAPGNNARGWYSRTYLPHMDSPGLYQGITFRLHDSVPAPVIQQWKDELSWREETPSADRKAVRLRQCIAEYEDAGHGVCWLADPRIATLVEEALLFFDGERYRLLAWCVMPNHVHALIETFADYPLAGILHSWKSFSATKANRALGRTGVFWAREYYDRFVRDGEHFARLVAYIEQNPVKAGLVDVPEAWRFSSAGKRE